MMPLPGSLGAQAPSPDGRSRTRAMPFLGTRASLGDARPTGEFIAKKRALKLCSPEADVLH